jgi:lysozyme family protein
MLSSILKSASPFALAGPIPMDEATGLGPARRMVVREGGYDKVTKDSGGVTRGGIAQSRGTHTAEQIRNLRPEDINAIWMSDWAKSGLRFPNPGTGEAFYDMYGNMGGPRATRLLQQQLNAMKAKGTPLPVDGRFGPMTQTALQSAPSPQLTRRLLAAQTAHHQKLIADQPKKYQRYAAGWADRRNQVRNLPSVQSALSPTPRMQPYPFPSGYPHTSAQPAGWVKSPAPARITPAARSSMPTLKQRPSPPIPPMTAKYPERLDNVFGW